MEKIKSPIKKSLIKWLPEPMAEANTYSPSEHEMKMDIPMPEDVGAGTIDVLSLELGMDVSNATLYFEPRMSGKIYSFLEVQTELFEPILSIFVAKKGRVILYDYVTDCDYIFGSGTALFQLTEWHHFIPKMDCSSTVSLYNLKLSMSVLESILGKNIANKLLLSLNLETPSDILTKPLPLPISGLLCNCLPAHLSGPLRSLKVQTDIMNFVNALTHHFLSYEEQVGQIDTQVINKIYQELITTEGKLPVLQELASKYGMCVNKLNEGFRLVYGKTIHRFIMDYRLELAHNELRSSNVAMKVISSRLGYSHVNNFIYAFKKKYGFPPGALRKSS